MGYKCEKLSQVSIENQHTSDVDKGVINNIYSTVKNYKAIGTWLLGLLDLWFSAFLDEQRKKHVAIFPYQPLLQSDNK